MRGLGKKQARIGFENRQKILHFIKQRNMISKQYCTMADLYRNLKINQQSLRNHVKTLLEREQIHEERIHNNARGFLDHLTWKKTESNFLLKFGYEERTAEHIDFMKFQKWKKLVSWNTDTEILPTYSDWKRRWGVF